MASLRLLIIEESEENALLLVQQLCEGGYEVTYEQVSSASNMQAALAREKWDAILAEYLLPDFSGLAGLSIYKEAGLEIPYIIVSSQIGEESAVEVLKAGAHDYVNKENLSRLIPVLERELVETAARQRRRRDERVQAAAFEISHIAGDIDSTHDLFRSIHAIIERLIPARSFLVALYHTSDDSLTYPYFAVQQAQAAPPAKTRRGLAEQVLRSKKPVLASQETIEGWIQTGKIEAFSPVPSSWLGVPLITKDKTIGVMAVESYIQEEDYGEEEACALAFVSNQVAVAIAHKQAEEALRQSEARYRSLFENSPVSLWQEDFSAVKAHIEHLRSQGINDFLTYFEKNPQAISDCMQMMKVVDINQATLKLYGAQKKEDLLNNLDQIIQEQTRSLFLKELLAIAEGRTEFEGTGINSRLSGERIDCVLRWTTSSEDDGSLSSLVVSVLDVTERKKSEEQIQSQLDRLAALRMVDMTITASLDIRVTLDVLLDQVTTQLKVDAANILLLDHQNQLLTFAAGRGFHSHNISRTCLHFSDPYAGRVALERRLLSVTAPYQIEGLLRSRQLVNENFQVYFGVPLLAKGQIKGVLEVFHRRPIYPDPDWMEFLETMAGQAAIAVDNASLFENLQRSNIELAMAYDASIEGWSRALDLRDHETEGHTARVTEVTQLLSSVMGLHEEEIIHIRRGALLHDIGKMGISDSILLKPGPLNEAEWEVMHKHPLYAYELLSPISHLNPSLDIPYCHHEKWDGSGYPRGLRGEQIPLPARIFAVVDVWDALRSNRPYRPAWPDEKVLEYIAHQQGKHFDPQIVDLFLKFVSNDQRFHRRTSTNSLRGG